MKFIIYILIFFSITPQLQATTLDDVYTWVDQEYKDFRTYPRITKAQQEIKKGKVEEAKVLLEKALAIDEKNQRALRTLISLCINEQDEKCIEKHFDDIEDTNLGYFYKANMQKAMKEKKYKKVIDFSKKSLLYNLKDEDKVFINRMLIESHIKLKKYDETTEHLNKENKLTDKELLKWSKFSHNLKENEYASILASKLSNNKENLKWQIELLSQRKKYKEASEKIETLYALDKSEENKKQLLYFYSLSGQDENIVQAYEEKLIAGCDSYSLFFLLDYHKNNKEKQIEILEENYPYSCIEEEKQDELSLQLLTLLEKENPKKAIDIARDIMEEVEYTYENDKTLQNKEKLIHLYQLSGENSKLMKMYDKELSENCNRRALFFLLDYYQDIKEEKLRILDENYPYACMSKEEKVNLSLQLMGMIEKTDSVKTKKIAKETLPDVEILFKHTMTSENRATLMHLYQLNGEEDKIMEVYDATLEKGCDNYALFYLLDYYQGNEIKQVELLEKHYPFECIVSEKRKELSLQLASYLSKTKSAKTIEILESLSLDVSDNKELQKVAALYIKLDKPLKALEIYEHNPESYNFQYHALNAKVAHKNNNCDMAANSYEKALAIEEYEHLRYAQINLLESCEKHTESLLLMQSFSDDYPHNLKYRKELAHMYSNNNEFDKAIGNFEYIAKQEPTKLNNHKRLAYLYTQVGDKENTIRSYKNAIDNAEDMDELWLQNTKNIIRDSNKPFSFYLSESVRLDKYDSPNSLAPINSAMYDGFGDLQLSFKPNIISDDLSLFLEVSHAYNHSLADTAQPSIGVRYKLLEKQNLYISAQKMFDTAKYTRDDTLLRASFGFFNKDNSPFYYNFYSDVGYFTDFGSTSLYGNYEYGKVYKLNESIDIAPYVTTGGTYSNDNNEKDSVTKLDVGIGVAMDIPFYETKYESNQFVNRVKIEGRQKYFGNAKDDKTIRLQWEFFY